MPVHEGLYQASLDNRSFRLVTLKPGLARDAVHVELTCHDMSNSPQYDAISYVWGHHGTMSQIFCNGTPTHVRPNLLWVLRRMRHPSQPRTLWIDALCINQNDHAERSLQVTIMGDIYSRAKHVFACIGDDPDGGASDVASLLKGNLEDPQQSDFDPRWVSLGVLLRQPWFSRAWVLQEVGLSQDPKVIYGNVKFRYRDLMELVLWVQRNAQWILSKADISSLLIHTNWYDWSSRGLKSSPSSSLRGNQDYEFLDLLDHASILECQDPRDHVYAFLSHPLAQKRRLNSSDRALITPDYRKSVIDVFKDVSVYLLEQSGLRTLSSVEHNESSIGAHFPSWVIRWDIGHVMNNMDRFPRHPPLYRADTEHKDVASSVLASKKSNSQISFVDIIFSYMFSNRFTPAHVLYEGLLEVQHMLTKALTREMTEKPSQLNIDDQFTSIDNIELSRQTIK
ncbi:heterokaryon incompatibility protein-domain-containing protein [Aspergillus novoparasiticus]|uniref:Heterokaryon incompatibility protein-domain-containing protein n=1 Tax=Aspergillus novoparasiticus TaxID=986946 RepID=A0A5N6ERH1_9EURO|nr:heterokaryon incompatibility protein-domain-containing protein [Aspergillus novoparasiticus]